MDAVLPRTALGRAVAVAYVLLVTGLAAVGVAHPNDGDDHWAFYVAAALLTLPTLVPLVPFIYVGGGLAWSLSGADRGGPELAVTVAYTSMLTFAAVANVCLLHVLFEQLKTGRRRSRAREAEVSTD